MSLLVYDKTIMGQVIWFCLFCNVTPTYLIHHEMKIEQNQNDIILGNIAISHNLCDFCKWG